MLHEEKSVRLRASDGFELKAFHVVVLASQVVELNESHVSLAAKFVTPAAMCRVSVNTLNDHSLSSQFHIAALSC